ncbi:SLAM family member 8-like isoform X1 [Anguilla rostrata]|uniref:SLAM family member 8-like isoform X1 n=1 Tax=Anguilla rostrata TaxID=7938 RepID=UPI0030CEB6A1
MRAAVILLYTCLIADVCVTSVQSKILNGILGQTITFPSVVKEIGFIFKNKSEIATVAGEIEPTDDRYGTRLQWNSSTGLFSLTDLRRGDSGEYGVQHKDGKTDDYQLVVWDPVPRPQVSSRNRMKPSCSVLCSVENGREVTLSWHREGQTLSHTSSPNFSSPLSVPLEIETNSAPYSCVATNPVSNKTVTVRPEEHCFGHGPHDALLYIMFVLRLVEFVLVTLAVGLLIHQYRKGRILTLPSTERRRRRRSSETVTEL